MKETEQLMKMASGINEKKMLASLTILIQQVGLKGMNMFM